MKKHDDDLKSVTVKLPVPLVNRLEKWGKRHGVTQRSDQIRMLLSDALNAADVKAKVPALPADLAARLAEYQAKRGKPSADDALNELLGMALDADEVDRQRTATTKPAAATASPMKTAPSPPDIGKVKPTR
jgi:Arc/MetJ-type ribon-helix-helix transcriptional regulator